MGIAVMAVLPLHCSVPSTVSLISIFLHLFGQVSDFSVFFLIFFRVFFRFSLGRLFQFFIVAFPSLSAFGFALKGFHLVIGLNFIPLRFRFHIC